MKKTPLRRKKPLGLGKYPLQRLAGALIHQEFERRKAVTGKPLGLRADRIFVGSSFPFGNKVEYKPMKRKPLRKKGARSKRSASALQAFREGTLTNARHGCDICGFGYMLEAHHLVNRARAPGWPDLHNPEVNGMALCRSCHAKATLEPRICGPRYLAAWAAHRDWILSPMYLKP